MLDRTASSPAHEECLSRFRHDHSFGQEIERPGERRTRIVIVLTVLTGTIEVAAGLGFGSMALLADGLHMASHAAALGIAAMAYAFARRHALDDGYAFGTGKANALGGFTGALVLAVFAAAMAAQSVARLFRPVQIAFDQALLVAVLGLLVNLVSAWILQVADHGRVDPNAHAHDHNLRSAYFHVLADALTSVLAIAALTVGKYWGATFVDPLMGVLGAVLVCRWSVGLLRSSGSVLLDRQAPFAIRRAMVAAIEQRAGDRVSDLHVWRIAPEGYAAVLTVVSAAPLSPDEYKRLIPGDLALCHLNVEVHGCPHE